MSLIVFLLPFHVFLIANPDESNQTPKSRSLSITSIGGLTMDFGISWDAQCKLFWKILFYVAIILRKIFLTT